MAETATAPTEAPETSTAPDIQSGSQPEADPSAPVTQPSSTPLGGSPEADGEETTQQDEAEAGEPPPWSTAKDADELFAHEAVAPKLAEREQAAEARGYERAYETVQPILQANKADLQTISSNLGRFRADFAGLHKAWADAAQAGAIDADVVDQFEKVLEKHGDKLDGLFNVNQLESGWDGIEAGVRKLYEAAGAEPDEKMAKRLEGLRRTNSYTTDPTFFKDAIAAIADAKAAPLREELKEAKAEVTRLKTEAKAAGRGDPPASPNGRAGRAAIKSYKDMTDDERAKLTPEQIDAMTAKYLQ